MNQQVKAGLSAVRDFLSGRSSEAKAAAASDPATREAVSAELLAAMSTETGTRETHSENKTAPERNASLAMPEQENDDTQPIDASEPSIHSHETLKEGDSGDDARAQEQERARQLFLEQGYFDEAVQNLRGAKFPAERAAAARALGLARNQRATAHLIAAMFDEDLGVRAAAEEALNQIGEATVGHEVSGKVASETTTAQESKSVAHEAPIESSVNESMAQPTVATETDSTTTPEVVDETSGLNAAAAQAQAAPDPDAEASLPASTREEDELLLQETTMRQSVAELDQRLLEVAEAFKNSENEIRSRIESEAKLRAEAAARRAEEDRLRREAEQEAEIRRMQELESFAAEQAARQQAEMEVRHHAEEESSLRLKAASLRTNAVALARQRAELERAREEAAESERVAQAARARDEVRARHEAELERLRNEEETLRQATEQVLVQQANVIAAREKSARELQQLRDEQAAVEASQRAEAERLRREAEKQNNDAQERLLAELENLRAAGDVIAKRRAEVDVAREKADADAERLLQTQARMQAAEEARAQAELERSRLEAEIKHQVETQLQLLEETRRRGQEEQERVQEEIRFNAEKEQQRLSEVEAMKAKAVTESQQRAEREQQILSQIGSLRIADAETRRRIEDAEVRRRAAEEAYRSIAEKVQRIEMEAHASTKEEERMLEKLEAERRSVAIEAQSRKEQEKRIREEIEMFRRLEEEERPRIEEATLQLAAAEARMQERKARLQDQLDRQPELSAHSLNEQPQPPLSPSFAPADAGARTGELKPGEWRTIGQESGANTATGPTSQDIVGAEPISSTETAAASVPAPPTVAPAIANFLNSVDPYKRAAAVSELARSGAPDAFSRITECFDDHSPHVRNAVARALRNLEPTNTVDLFNRALENASAERRRNIGAAIAASGMADEAIRNLGSDNREDTYNALSILFVMAKTGEVAPLVRALEVHGTNDIGKAVSKLLALSGHAQS